MYAKVMLLLNYEWVSVCVRYLDYGANFMNVTHLLDLWIKSKNNINGDGDDDGGGGSRSDSHKTIMVKFLIETDLT